MNYNSGQMSRINAEYRKTKKVIMETRPQHCSGCGRRDYLSFSHTFSRADCSGYGQHQLVYDIANIEMECMDNPEGKGCHSKWEQGQRTDNTARRLAYLKRLSESIGIPEIYERYKNKFDK